MYLDKKTECLVMQFVAEFPELKQLHAKLVELKVNSHVQYVACMYLVNSMRENCVTGENRATFILSMITIAQVFLKNPII